MREVSERFASGLFRCAVVCLLCLAAAGCGRHTAQFEDDIELLVNVGSGRSPLTAGKSVLHTPYVVGAKFNVGVLDNGDGSSADLYGWTFSSSAPSVIQVVARGFPLTVALSAVGAGSASLVVRDENGAIVGNETVQVMVPDSATVLANAPRFIGRPDSAATVDGARVLVGGTATFLVEWSAGGVALSGAGALAVGGAGTAMVNTVSFPASPVHDWFQVRPTDAEPVTLSLLAATAAVRPFVVLPAAAAAVASVALVGDSENGASQDTFLRLLGQAYDSEGQTIFGVDFNWSLDGQSNLGTGDCLSYDLDSTSPTALAATALGQETDLTIHQQDPAVLSSNTAEFASTVVAVSQPLSRAPSPTGGLVTGDARGPGAR